MRISSSDEEIGGARAALLARVGRLDAIVDNASINGVWAPIDDLMPNEWDRIVRVNLRGTYLTLAFALSPHPVRLLYSATKGAQVAMAQQLALELGRHSIRSTFFVRARSLPKYQPRRISGTASMGRPRRVAGRWRPSHERRARQSCRCTSRYPFSAERQREAHNRLADIYRRRSGTSPVKTATAVLAVRPQSSCVGRIVSTEILPSTKPRSRSVRPWSISVTE